MPKTFQLYRYKQAGFAAFLLMLFFLSGCESPVEENFPYELKLVIRGILEEGKPVTGVSIGRTTTIEDTVNPGIAQLTDAIAVIKNRDKVYTLRHQGNGIYNASNLIPKAGESYTLVVRWGNKEAGAETYIPLAGSVSVGKFKRLTKDGKTRLYVAGTVFPAGDEAYCATWGITGTTGQIYDQSTFLPEVVKGLSNGLTGYEVTTDEISSQSINSDVVIIYHIYDGSFYNYFNSQSPKQVSDAVFGQPLSTVQWNIKGSGIGMFIGKTTKLQSVIRPQ